jgi:hypothetical protein
MDQVKPQSKKWKLFPVFAWSLLVGLALLALIQLKDGGAEITDVLSHNPAQGMGYIIGNILSLPILCTIIAVIRNLFVK